MNLRSCGKSELTLLLDQVDLGSLGLMGSSRRDRTARLMLRPRSPLSESRSPGTRWTGAPAPGVSVPVPGVRWGLRVWAVGTEPSRGPDRLTLSQRRHAGAPQGQPVCLALPARPAGPGLVPQRSQTWCERMAVSSDALSLGAEGKRVQLEVHGARPQEEGVKSA